MTKRDNRTLLSPFQTCVHAELQAARRKFPPLHSPHEALAVLWEELEEFKTEVFRRQDDRDSLRMFSELVQLAAMCQRTAEDCGLVATAETAP